MNIRSDCSTGFRLGGGSHEVAPDEGAYKRTLLQGEQGRK